MSTTVTVNEQVAVFPDASVAIAVTVVVPFGKVDPDAGLATTATPGQLSLAVTVKLTTAEQRFAAAGTLIFAGHVITGGWVSFTVTVNEQLDEFPAASLTPQVTVVVPLGKVDPDAGLQVGLPTPGQLSLTAGEG